MKGVECKVILSSLELWEKESHLYPSAIQRAVKFLIDSDFSKLSVGKYEIENESMFALVQEVQTEDVSLRKPESHRQYTDIQLLLQGEEIIGITRSSERNIVSVDELENKDYLLYSHVENESFVTLQPGMFVVLFPTDIHRPCCKASIDSIRKVVVKIDNDLFMASV